MVKQLISMCFLFLILFSCSTSTFERGPSSSKNPVKHVVFDIDWTIASEVAPDFSGPRTIAVGGEKYFIFDGLENLIEELLSHPEVKISFFSGGEASRNHQLLKKIKLNDGRSLEEIAYKILSFDDLTPISSAKSTDKFSLRFKKDLTKISKDLSQLIMIEDTEHFVLNADQEEHVFFLGTAFKHFDQFSQAKLESGPYIPRTFNEWDLSRKRLMILEGAFSEAFNETSFRTKNLSEAMKAKQQLLDLSSGEWNEYSSKLYRMTAARMEHPSRITLRLFH